MGTHSRKKKTPANANGTHGNGTNEIKQDYKKEGSPTRGRKVLGVDFAPINVPWERRMQTLGVLTWVAIFLTGSIGPLLMIYLLFYAKIYLFPILYIAWIIYDRNTSNEGGRRLQSVREWKIWKFYRDYFPVTLIKTVDLDPKKNYLFASHPHGIICNGVFACFATEGLGVEKVFPGIDARLLTLELSFWLPIFREFVLAAGFCTVSKKSINYLLSYPGGGKAAVLVPGGASESLDAHPGSYIIQLKKRKGFIKIALQNGAPLVPVFSFGETDIYDQWNNPEGSLLRTIQNRAMKTLTFAPIFVQGRGIFQYSFGLLPNRRPITTVVGAPIEVEKVVEPTNEQVDELHEKYINALKELFYAHREKYADSKAEIIIR